MTLLVRQNEDEEHPAFRGANPFAGDPKIYMQMEFTKSIVWKYQQVLIILISLLTVTHYCSIILQKIQTKLIQKNNSVPAGSAGSITGRALVRVNMFLLSEVSIPVMSSLFNNNENLIVIVSYYISNLFVLCYRVPWNQPFIFSLRSGLVAGCNIALLYLVPLKSGPLALLISRSYENILVYHKFVGVLVISMALIHTISFCYTLNWYYIFRDTACLTGMGCITTFIFIGITSLNYIRTRYYELFYIVHIACFTSFLPIFYFHHKDCRPFVGFVIVCLIWDRSVRWLCKSWILQGHILASNEEVMLISIDTSPNNLPIWAKIVSSICLFKIPKLAKFNWSLSDHLFINIPTVALFQSHPFTIATPPNGRNLMLIVKIHNGFTKKLYIESLNHPNDTFTCIIHGPYGSSSKKFPQADLLEHSIPPFRVNSVVDIAGTFPLINNAPNPQNKSHQNSFTEVATLDEDGESSSSSSSDFREKIILVAGGVGVSFTLPLFQQYYENPFYDVAFIWVIRNPSQSSLIDINRSWKSVQIWCTSTSGRPFLDDLIHQTIELNNAGKVNIMACGPRSLLSDVRRFAKEQTVNGCDVNLVIEEFSF